MKVGYQNRDGTYTGRLAYVIYYDNKGKLRKEASWQSWRDNKIEPDEFNNVPTEGFVLNKKVGGYSNGWGDFRQAYVRVYDPRGFEFEITVPNLLYILEHTSSIKGKGLEGEFVYAWEGTELVLLPAAAPDYAELTKLNDQRFKNETVKAKDIQIGATYLHNSNVEWVYMGRFDYYGSGYLCSDGQWFESYRKASKYCEENNLYRMKQRVYGYSSYQEADYTYADGCAGKRHCFYDRSNNCFCWPKSLSGLLIDTITTEPAVDYAELFEQLERTTKYSPYDQTKDENIDYSLEELNQQLPNNRYGKTFRTRNDAAIKIRKVESCEDDQLGFTCEYADYIDKRMEKVFPHQDKTFGSSCYKEMIPVPLEEIFNKFQFYYTKQYLANGKYYRTVW